MGKTKTPCKQAADNSSGNGWYSRPELNWDQRFRKPLLYPFELRERSLIYKG